MGFGFIYSHLGVFKSQCKKRGFWFFCNRLFGFTGFTFLIHQKKVFFPSNYLHHFLVYFVHTVLSIASLILSSADCHYTTLHSLVLQRPHWFLQWQRLKEEKWCEAWLQILNHLCLLIYVSCFCIIILFVSSWKTSYNVYKMFCIATQNKPQKQSSLREKRRKLTSFTEKVPNTLEYFKPILSRPWLFSVIEPKHEYNAPTAASRMEGWRWIWQKRWRVWTILQAIAYGCGEEKEKKRVEFERRQRQKKEKREKACEMRNFYSETWIPLKPLKNVTN